jgi:hypothetical protein
MYTFTHVSIDSHSHRRSANFLDTYENSQMTTRKKGMKMFKDHKHQGRLYDCHPHQQHSTKQHTTKNARNFASFRQFTRPDRDLGAATRQFLLEVTGILVNTELGGRTCYFIGLTLNHTGAVLAGIKRLGSEGSHSTASGVEAKNVKITTPTRNLLARFKKA